MNEGNKSYIPVHTKRSQKSCMFPAPDTHRCFRELKIGQQKHKILHKNSAPRNSPGKPNVETFIEHIQWLCIKKIFKCEHVKLRQELLEQTQSPLSQSVEQLFSWCLESSRTAQCVTPTREKRIPRNRTGNTCTHTHKLTHTCTHNHAHVPF